MRLSTVIQALLKEYVNQPLPIEVILERTGKQSFGILCGLLTLPLLIPIPLPLAGFSTLLGSGVMLMGVQLALGFQRPYLPKCLAKKELSPLVSRRLLHSLNRILAPIEKIAQVRLLKLTQNRYLCRFLGVCLAWNAFLMALPLPIPFTNLLPAYSILILSIGMLESDGLLILIGFSMTAITSLFFVSITGGIWAFIRQFISFHFVEWFRSNPC